MKLSAAGVSRDVRVEESRAVVDRDEHAIRSIGGESGASALEVDGMVHHVRTARRGDRVFVWCDGDVWEFGPAADAARSAHAREDLLAPMTGRVRKLLVTVGEGVEAGRPLVVLEAMKMEHTIRSPRAGTVRELPHGEGDLVDAGTPLVELA